MSKFHPSLEHFVYTDYEEFYEPSDDTFLLCDALEADLLQGRPASQDALITLLEIGSGSGCVSTFVCKLLKGRGDSPVPHIMWATDINPRACEATTKTAAANGASVDVVRCDFASAFACRFDCVIFNPPYVPTPAEEVGGDGIEAAWAGGEDGRVVIDRLLPVLPGLLAPSGRCYMVLVEENRPQEVMALLRSRGLSSTVVLKRQARNETLYIVRFDAPP